MAELVHHCGALNGVVWAPHSPNHICTIADDKQALIWDITTKSPVRTGYLYLYLYCTCHSSYPHPSLLYRITTIAFLSLPDLIVQIIEDPILAFAAEGEINQLQWDASHEDWVAICFHQSVQLLKV